MIKRALEYWKIYGTKALLSRLIFGPWRTHTGVVPLGAVEPVAESTVAEPTAAVEPAAAVEPTAVAEPAVAEPAAAEPAAAEPAVELNSIEAILFNRFPALIALPVYSSPKSVQRVNLVTDSINDGSLFGGVATSIIFATLLANEKKCPIRLITRTESAIKNNFFKILKAHGFDCDNNVEFVYVNACDSKVKVDVCDDDIFITTSWWTTECVRRNINEENIIYLLQEDERMFYPLGDDHLRCSEIIGNEKIRFVINSRLLFDHFISEGFDNIAKRGKWFEPSFEKALLYRGNGKISTSGKMNFFFYARPNHVRNLFNRGVEVIEAAVSQGILSLDDWEINFVGGSVANLTIGDSYKPLVHAGLEWDDYCELIRSMDLGLSLMYTPHPSYPPLDLAASGAVVVTNRFGVKQDLSKYSKNIICVDTDLESLVQGLAEGIKLALNKKTRSKNYTNNTIGRDWVASFSKVIRWIGGSNV